MLESTDPRGGFALDQLRKDVVLTNYDLPVTLPALGNDYQQAFLAGRVASTSKYTVFKAQGGSDPAVSQTWFSYDEQGRTKWVVRQLFNQAPHTLDYDYDFTGNVLSVCYRKNDPTTRFTHYYSYDADQRLSEVRTNNGAPTDPAVPRKLQATYSYYLHGPLKRVVVGGLQGMDYLYTAQGWLKSINGLQQGTDPAGDAPTTTGLLADLFSQELEYYAGDYASSRTSPGTFTSTGNHPERFDGTLRALAWRTPSHPGLHGYGYRYDERGQLAQADYGQPVPGTGGNVGFAADPAQRYAEGNLSYDPNGNLKSLQRTDRLGADLMNIGYEYLGNTNKLKRVSPQSSTATGIDYTYDELGQLASQLEPGANKYFDYDVSGKVTSVYRDAARTNLLAQYVYDEFGQRIRQTVYKTTGETESTDYIRDAAGNEVASYYSDLQGTHLAEQPIYGAARLGVVRQARDAEPGSQLYELNDQLGNTRVVFRAPQTDTYTLTMENGRTDQEKRDFPTPDATTYDQVRSSGYARQASPYGTGYSMYLAGRVGPGKKLAVAPGDRVLLEVYAGYPSTSGAITGAARPPVAQFGVLGAGALLPPAQTENRAARSQPAWQQLLSRASLGLAFPLAARQRSATVGGPAPLRDPPNASLRYVLRRVRDQAVLRTGAAPVTANAEGRWELLSLDVAVDAEEPAELEVWVQNSDAQGLYFDDLRVEHRVGPVVQENHFYAYGQRNAGLSWARQAVRGYGRGYQGQSTRFDEETGYDSFELRNYDSRIGRWTSTDPMGQYYSPYVGMGNDPVSRINNDGGFDIYSLFSDGTMGITKTNDNFNEYYYIDLDNNYAVTHIATLDKRQNNLVEFWGYGNGYERYGPLDLVKTGGSYGNGDHWLDPNAAGSLLASAWEWQGRSNSTGSVPLQFGDMSGSDSVTPNTSHIGGHNGGRNIDVRYPRIDHKTLPVTVNDSQFDRKESTRLVSIFAKWGFKSILSFPNSQGYLLEGTKQYKGHDNHLHLQGYTPNLKK